MQTGRAGRAVALGVALTLCSVATLTSSGDATADGAAPAVVATMSIGSASVTETNSLTTTMSFAVTASATASSAMSANYATANGTAVAPGDYTAKSGTVTIPAGSRTATITVSVAGDKLDEKNETFTVTLSNPVNATLGSKTGTGTIIDDDAAPVVSVSAASVTEANSGTTSMVFTVKLSAASGLPVSVNYQTANGTAKAPGDYTTTSGVRTIPAGALNATVSVPVVGDALYEGNETFTFTISNPVNATLGTANGTGTIVDNDVRPSVSVASASVAEGNTGTTPIVFTVTSSAVSGLPVTVSYATTDGTAKTPGDYTAKTGSVTIPAGAKSATFTVPVVGDAIDEPNETFTVTLSSPVNATLGVASATGTITDDDAAPTVSIAPASLAEGNSGTTAMTFTVSMPVASGLSVSVNYATANGTASAPGDYTAKTGSVTIPAGATSATFTVLVVGDTIDEANETFTVTLSNPMNATLGTAKATGTIIDQDASPVVSIAAASATEGNSSTTSAVFTVTTSAVSGRAVTVSFATADGTAHAPGDYVATTGSVTIPAGSTSRTFTVSVVGDTLYERNESFSVALSAPVNATLGTATATGTIVDDDPVPVVSISGTSGSEGNSGATPMPFTVSLSAVSGLPVSAHYATANGSAQAPADYSVTNGTVTVAAGTTSASVDVPIVGDLIYEANETFTLTLSSPVNATLGVAVATGTILADDDPPVVSVGDASLAEGDTGTTPEQFHVTLDGASSVATTVDYATQNGTAIEPGDYVNASGSVTIPAGATEATFNVAVVGDGLHENDETFTVTLSNPTAATLGRDTATGTIVDDDAAPAVLLAGNVSVPGGASGTTTPAVFHVALTFASGAPVTVHYATADGTAKQPDNYTATAGTLTIAAGNTTATITVPVIGGMPHEGNRTFTLTLSAPSGATLGSPATATGTIVDEHRLGIATGAILWNKTAAEREAELADLENLGAQWVRTTLLWRDVQPIGPNAYDWTKADSIVASANQHHVAIIYQVIGAPLWSVPGSQPGDKYDYPPDPSLYGDFVATVAARYYPQGVTAYELGNSPNLVNAGNTPDPAFYASLLCTTYAAVKAVVPAATILTAGLGGTRDKNGNYSAVHFVQLLYANGAGGCFDAISFHPYTWPQFPPDDGTDGWSAMLSVRQLMATNGDGEKKIWVTEFGAPTGGTGGVSEATQAQMLDVAYRLFVTYSWAGPMCWFRYDDKSGDPTDPGNFYGLVRADGSHKPAYATFAADAAAAIP